MGAHMCTSKMKYKSREVHIDSWITADEMHNRSSGQFPRPSWCMLNALRSGDHIKVGNSDFLLMLRVCEYTGWKQNILCEVIQSLTETKTCPYKPGDILLIEMKHVLQIIPHENYPKIGNCGQYPNLRAWLNQLV
jgi:hypothetical protein